MLETPVASCGTSLVSHLVREDEHPTVTIRRWVVQSDHAGQPAGKAGRRLVVKNPQRPYARHEQGLLRMKRWSDPHGDVGSQAEPETTWPPVLIEDRR